MDDCEFQKLFEAAAIPAERWMHGDHIRMAFLYLRDLPFDDAVSAIRVGIGALNRANGVPQNATSGYHETVTIAWAQVVASAIANHGPVEDSQSFLAANPHLLSKTLLRVYYSRARILGPEARERFVQPDLAPLPRLPDTK